VQRSAGGGAELEGSEPGAAPVESRPRSPSSSQPSRWLGYRPW